MRAELQECNLATRYCRSSCRQGGRLGFRGGGCPSSAARQRRYVDTWGQREKEKMIGPYITRGQHPAAAAHGEAQRKERNRKRASATGHNFRQKGIARRSETYIGTVTTASDQQSTMTNGYSRSGLPRQKHPAATGPLFSPSL